MTSPGGGRTGALVPSTRRGRLLSQRPSQPREASPPRPQSPQGAGTPRLRPLPVGLKGPQAADSRAHWERGDSRPALPVTGAEPRLGTWCRRGVAGGDSAGPQRTATGPKGTVGARRGQSAAGGDKAGQSGTGGDWAARVSSAPGGRGPQHASARGRTQVPGAGRGTLPFLKGIAQGALPAGLARYTQAGRRPSGSPAARGASGRWGRRGRGKGHIWSEPGASPRTGGPAAKQEARSRGVTGALRAPAGCAQAGARAGSRPVPTAPRRELAGTLKRHPPLSTRRNGGEAPPGRRRKQAH